MRLFIKIYSFSRFSGQANASKPPKFGQVKGGVVGGILQIVKYVVDPQKGLYRIERLKPEPKATTYNQHRVHSHPHSPIPVRIPALALAPARHPAAVRAVLIRVRPAIRTLRHRRKNDFRPPQKPNRNHSICRHRWQRCHHHLRNSNNPCAATVTSTSHRTIRPKYPPRQQQLHQLQLLHPQRRFHLAGFPTRNLFRNLVKNSPLQRRSTATNNRLLYRPPHKR